VCVWENKLHIHFFKLCQSLLPNNTFAQNIRRLDIIAAVTLDIIYARKNSPWGKLGLGWCLLFRLNAESAKFTADDSETRFHQKNNAFIKASKCLTTGIFHGEIFLAEYFEKLNCSKYWRHWEHSTQGWIFWQKIYIHEYLQAHF
jgi:hypothetical protein